MTQQLRDLKNKADSRGRNDIRSVIPNFDSLPPSVQTYLLTPKTLSNTRALFGTAVEDMIDKELRARPDFSEFERLYNLEFNTPLSGQTVQPDIQFTLPDGSIVVIDFTSVGQIDTKWKYDLPGVRRIVVVTHGGPTP